MKKSKLTVLIKICLVCFCQLVLVGLTKAQVNYCRARDSIENSYKRIHLQNQDYKTKDYSDCVTQPHCGTVDPRDKSTFKPEVNSVPSFDTEIKVIEIQSIEPKKPAITTTPN